MRGRLALGPGLGLALVLLAPVASAHLVLVPGRGDSLVNATDLVTTPARAFDELPAPGGYHYYTINLSARESVHVRLLARDDAFREAFPPRVVVAGALEDTGARPSNLTFRAGDGVAQYVARFDRPDFEDGALPLRAKTLNDFTLAPNASGPLTLVVYSNEYGGRYALWVEDLGAHPVLDRVETPLVRPQAWTWAGVSPTALAGGGLLGAALAAACLAPRVRAVWASGPRRAAAIGAMLLGATGGARVGAAVAMGAPWMDAAAEVALALPTALVAGFVPAGARLRASCAIGALAQAGLAYGWLVAPAALLIAALWP